MNELIRRGTPAAVAAIQYIDEKVPDANLKRLAALAQDVLSERSWLPLSPGKFLDLIYNQSEGLSRGKMAAEGVRLESSLFENESSGSCQPIAAREFRKISETWVISFGGWDYLFV